VIVAVEGVDGAGKHTLTRRLEGELTSVGRTVAILSFPRYGVAPLGPVVRSMLAGEPTLAGLASSVRGAALLFALDRGACAAEVAETARRCDVVLIDRYVASNAAYGAARLPPDERPAFLDWVAAVELGDLALPRPDLQVLLRVSVETARSRAAGRAAGDPARPLDAFEADGGLQERCARVYDGLAADAWVSPWLVLDGGEGYDRLVAVLAG
jgi:dTMP kinase